MIFRTQVTRGVKNEQATPKRTRQRVPNNPTTTGFRISDELWAVLLPRLSVHINTHRFGGGRPRVPDRRCADAIFYVLRTGCQWQALDQTELCAHSTAHDRFQEWGETVPASVTFCEFMSSTSVLCGGAPQMMYILCSRSARA